MNGHRGNYWFCGTTQVKKTTHANAMAWAARDATGCGILVIDSQRAWNFREYPHPAGRRELYERVFGRRGVCAYTPRDPDEVGAIYRAVKAQGNVAVLMDEAFFWLSKRKMILDVSTALRTWAHHGALMLFTTQRVGDIHEDALAVDGEIRVYRTISRKDQERLWDDYDIKADEVKDLPVGSYVTVRNSVAVRGGNGCLKVTAEA